MKKIYYRITALFLAILVLFIGFPFNSLNRVKAETNVATNFIDFLRTNLGLSKVNNGSLSNVSRDDFAQSLYNTPLVWTDNGVNFSFTPSDEFSKSQWNHMCIYGGSDDTRFVDFDLQDCLIKSQYIEDNGSGLNLSNFPKLADNTNTVSPLDGVEVITNFSDFSPRFSMSYRPSYSPILFKSIKNLFLSENNNLVIVAGINGNNANSFSCGFLSFADNDTYYYFIAPSSPNNFQSYISYGYKTVDSWKNSDLCSATYNFSSSSGKDNYLYSINYGTRFNHLFFTNSVPSSLDTSSTSISETECHLFFRNNPTSNYPLEYWSNRPVVIASNHSVGQNYYYWMNGTPDGSFYSTANTNTVYSYDYITNNNWETAYNNYITDVSNYYSTTENITNEQLSQYIDNSTNITYITNNYIDNSGSGGESGGGSVDSGILASWLEKIFDRVTDIYNALIGKDDSGDIYYNDNSIRYSIIEYPLSDLFPSVPQSRFIPYSDIFDFGIAQNHLNNVMRQIIPFCYLYQLQTIATALASPPQAPHYEIPFVIERLNIDEQITIDLTSSAWITIHSIWITLFMIMLIFALLYATYKFLILLNSIFG